MVGRSSNSTNPKPFLKKGEGYVIKKSENITKL